MGSVVLTVTALCLAMSGCAASLVERNYGPPKSGRASFVRGGADFVNEGRRREALEEIRKYCGGEDAYTLEGESTTGTAWIQQNIEIRFVCDK